MPFFNAEQFLPEAVESVEAQTFTDWELILVDDGSTDGSTAYARGCAERIPERVRYLEHAAHRNRGATVSRNLGLAHARGEYLALLDADDVWLPEKLAQQVELLDERSEAVMVFGDPLYWRSWSGSETDAAGDERRGIWTPANTVVPRQEMLTLSYPLGRGGSPCPSDLLLRRDLVNRIGGFEESFTGIYQLFEDIAFLAKVYLNGAVLVSDACWLKYRIHPDSCVATVRKGRRYHQVRHYYLRWLRSYLRRQRITDPEIWRALERALGRYDPWFLEWLRRQAHRASEYLRVAPGAAGR